MFQPTEYRDVPFVDLLTWTFGNDRYDLDKPLFIHARKNEKSFSHNQAKTIVRKLIAGLKANGLRVGDSVCLHSYNCIEYPLVYLAVIGAGGRFVGSNPSYSASELRHLYTISEVKLILTDPELLQNVRFAVKDAGIPSSQVLMFNTDFLHNTPDFASWEKLLEHGESDWIAFDDEATAKSTVVTLMSTSGTTGLPKAAQSSHFSQVAQSVMLMEENKPYEVIRLLCLPQFHAFNAPLAFIAPLREGHTTYIMPRYEPHGHLEYLAKHTVTETTMVNPIIFHLLSLPEESRKQLSTLRAVYCGGVPLDAAVQNQFNKILHPDAIVSQVYGMTEVFWITGFKYPEKDDTGSAGRLLPNVEARILDEDGEDLSGDCETGHILVRGPSLMIGYLNNPNTSEDMIVDGWLRTGDIGYQKEGKWYIVDRAKELIKVRGWQVSPTEIEACLRSHPAIKDACVIGVDFKDQRGELPRAYVVLEQGVADSMTEEDVQDYVRQHLAKYKALDGGVQFRPSIPRSPAGKPYKRIFRTEAREEILAEKIRLASVAASIVEGELDKGAITAHEVELAADGVLEAALESLHVDEADVNQDGSK